MNKLKTERVNSKRTFFLTTSSMTHGIPSKTKGGEKLDIFAKALGENQVAQIMKGEGYQALKIYQEDDFGEAGHGYQPAKCISIDTEEKIIALRDFLNNAYPPDCQR